MKKRSFLYELRAYLIYVTVGEKKFLQMTIKTHPCYIPAKKLLQFWVKIVSIADLGKLVSHAVNN